MGSRLYGEIKSPQQGRESFMALQLAKGFRDFRVHPKNIEKPLKRWDDVNSFVFESAILAVVWEIDCMTIRKLVVKIFQKFRERCSLELLGGEFFTISACIPLGIQVFGHFGGWVGWMDGWMDKLISMLAIAIH